MPNGDDHGEAVRAAGSGTWAGWSLGEASAEFALSILGMYTMDGRGE